MTDQGGWMAGIANSDFTGFRGVSANQRCVLPRQHAFTKQTARAFSQLVHTECERNETPENSVKLGHEHRCRYAFAGYIADSKIDIGALCLKNIYIISADQTGRFVKILKMPPIDVKVVSRK